MIYTNTKSFPDRLSRTLGKTLNKLALVSLGLLVTSCEWKSPPLVLNDDAKFALKMDGVQKQLDAYHLQEQKELHQKKQTPEATQAIPVKELRAKFFGPEVNLRESVTAQTTESLASQYINKDTSPADAILILNELVSRKAYSANIGLLIARIDNTKKQGTTATDVNAYVSLLSTFFSKVNPATQVRILGYVQKTWKNDPFTDIAYTTLHSTMLKFAKVPEVHEQVIALIKLMERSGHEVVLASQDKRYDSLDGGYLAPPDGLQAAGGGGN